MATIIPTRYLCTQGYGLRCRVCLNKKKNGKVSIGRKLIKAGRKLYEERSLRYCSDTVPNRDEKLTSIVDVDIVHLEIDRSDAKRTTCIVTASILGIGVECNRGLVASIAGSFGGVAIYCEQRTASLDIDLVIEVLAT